MEGGSHENVFFSGPHLDTGGLTLQTLYPHPAHHHLSVLLFMESPDWGVWRRTGIFIFFFIFFFNSPRSAVVSFSFLYSHTLGAATDNNLSTHWQWNHTVLLILLLTVKWLLCYRDRAIGQPLKISVHQWLKTIVIVSINISLTQITDGSVFCYL